MKHENRTLYLDYSRAFACILVVLGHLLLSFQDAGFIDNVYASFFRKAIYHFHVYIFFFCSGFLFQKSFSQCADTKVYFKKKLIRCSDFAITYIIFSFITYFIKTILSSNVNSEVSDSFLNILLHSPINQMWYLYALVIIILCTPLIHNKRGVYCMLLVALVENIIFYVLTQQGVHIPLPFFYLLQHQTWFILGTIWEYKQIKLKPFLAFTFGSLFFVLALIVFITKTDYYPLNCIIRFFGIIGTVEIIRFLTKNATSISFIWKYISKYMYQIYLLHTIFAAGIRIILTKAGINNLWIHIVFGLFFSFVVPIVCAMLAEKFSLFNIVFFPSKTIEGIKNKTK